MLAGLLQMHTFAGTIERNLTIFTATLRANASVYGQAETFFFALFADGTTQDRFPRTAL
jgi:hypothetical protein